MRTAVRLTSEKNDTRYLLLVLGQEIVKFCVHSPIMPQSAVRHATDRISKMHYNEIGHKRPQTESQTCVTEWPVYFGKLPLVGAA